jgi:hypothetical protein
MEEAREASALAVLYAEAVRSLSRWVQRSALDPVHVRHLTTCRRR